MAGFQAKGPFRQQPNPGLFTNFVAADVRRRREHTWQRVRLLTSAATVCQRLVRLVKYAGERLHTISFGTVLATQTGPA
jgi:hypothetical protein